MKSKTSPNHRKKELTYKITQILLHTPEARDDDRILLANVWYHEATGVFSKDISNIPLFDFLKVYQNGKKAISSSESIRRIRQKLQEEYVGLRGKKYVQRQKHSKTIQMTINKPGNHELKFSV